MNPPMDDNLDPGATCSIDPYVDLRTIPAGWSLANTDATAVPPMPEPEADDEATMMPPEARL